jgi:hypothetical protein
MFSQLEINVLLAMNQALVASQLLGHCTAAAANVLLSPYWM